MQVRLYVIQHADGVYTVRRKAVGLEGTARFVETGITHVLIKPCPPDVIASELRRLIHGSAHATPIS